MTDLCSEIIVPPFGENKYIYEIRSKPEFILYLLIKSNQLKVAEISRIDVIVGGDHGQGAFRFLIKILFVIKSEKCQTHK